MLRFSPILTALLLIPAFAGADEKPADVPDAMLMTSFTEMCQFWTQDSIEKEKAHEPVARSTLSTCAWMFHNQALRKAGRNALPFDSWSATQMPLTGKSLDDAAFLQYYRQYIAQYQTSSKEEDRSQGKEVREISARDYEALQYGLIAASETSPVRLRMLRLLVNDALSDGRIDVEEYAVIRPVLYDSNTLASAGALSLPEARQAVKDELAREAHSAQ